MAALIGMGSAAPSPALSASPSTRSLCRGGEAIIYSCRFGGNVGSVCLGESDVHYRFGVAGRRVFEVGSDAAWSNIHTGGNRSQAGLNQDHIRFTNGNTHYIVHSDETGGLNETPGRRSSGIVVVQGPSGADEIARLDCKARTRLSFDRFLDIRKSAPKDWDGEEENDGPFDAIY